MHSGARRYNILPFSMLSGQIIRKRTILILDFRELLVVSMLINCCSGIQERIQERIQEKIRNIGSEMFVGVLFG